MYRWLCLAPVILTATAELSAQADEAVMRAAETITAADVARHVGVIAHDSMMGRGTPGPGLEMTAQYVADQFERLGLTPGGDNGTWFQRYPIPRDSTRDAPNTIGLLEGSDPKLKDEYIVFLAHMDHNGVNSGQEGDSINNGADDNGSGTAGIIELAEAFTRPGARPRRSLMFVTFSGEEQMGWGSRYFMAHPPKPIAQLAAAVNLDMIARNAVDSVGVLGMDETDLGPIMERVARTHPELRLKPVPAGSAFTFDSDHYFFAHAGVPTVFFHSGLHGDYHQVTDAPERVDNDKGARVLRLAFYTLHEAADRDRRPQWNELGQRNLAQEQKDPEEERVMRALRKLMGGQP